MKVGKIIGRIFVLIFVVGVLVILGRIFMMEDNGSLTKIIPTETAKEAYASLGEDAFLTHSFRASISSDGYFSAHSLVYSRESRELQLTGRYNESVFEYLGVQDGSSFYWELRDEEGNTIAVAEIADQEEKYFYRHFRLIFSDVTIEEGDTLLLFLCCDEVEYPQTDTEGFPVHRPGQEWKTYKLNKEERSALSS